MAVLLEKLYSDIGPKYHLKLIAGEEGIFNLVDWVNIVENNNLISFQKQNELVISTGVANHDEEGIVFFCKQLYSIGISGLIINIGPYIKSISPKIISYCNEVGFPLFVLPWEVRLVDIMHDMGRFILKREQIENNLSEAIQSAIFSPQDQDIYKKILSKNGLGADTKYCLISLAMQVMAPEKAEYYGNLVANKLIRNLNRINSSFIFFTRDRRINIVTANYGGEETDSVKNSIQDLQTDYAEQVQFHAVISPRDLPVELLSNYYKRLNVMLRVACKKDLKIVEYDKEVVYKLLLAVESAEEIRGFYSGTYGKLVEYDKTNHTDYCDLLKQYFERNGSVQQVAEINFVHRNTINYHLRKIEKICGVNLENWDDRLKIHLSMFISELL